MTPNKNESEPSILKFKRQSVADLSPLEWLFLVLSIFAFGCAAALTMRMFAEEKPDSPNFVLAIVLGIIAEEKPDSPNFVLAIVLGIIAVFLLVYSVHGVFWRMPYSLLLHCLCHVVLVAYCIVYYPLLNDKESVLKGEQMPNGDQKSKIAVLVLGATAGVVEVLFVPYLFRKYWQARTMIFPWGAETHNQDENVKHLLVMCLLLLNLHLELTFVVLVLKIKKTVLATAEIVQLVLGVTYSTSMCVFGFLFLYNKWKLLVFVISLASLAELAYIKKYLTDTGLNWQVFPDEVVPAFIFAVSIANLAVRSCVCCSVIYIYKYIRTEIDMSSSSKNK